jgi:molybdenum cofactor cytidylyltransferase
MSTASALGDMPLVRPETIAALLAAFRPGSVVVPRRQAQLGNPVLWDRSFVPAMRELRGDRGARSLMPQPPALIAVDVDDPGVLMDFDTPESLTKWIRLG